MRNRLLRSIARLSFKRHRIHFDLLAKAGLRRKQNHQGRGIGRAAKRAPSQLSFHSLRHTAVNLLKDAGIPQASVGDAPWRTQVSAGVCPSFE